MVVAIEVDNVLEKLVRDYGKLVYSVCLRLVGDPYTAEDAAQETFLAAWRSLDSFDGKNEKAWLSRIAANKSLDYLRSPAARAAPAEDKELHLVETAASPEEEFFAAETGREVRRACENLKEPYRSVALGYYCEDKPLSQIADEQGVPLKTVQTHQYRAKKMLETALKEAISV